MGRAHTGAALKAGQAAGEEHSWEDEDWLQANIHPLSA